MFANPLALLALSLLALPILIHMLARLKGRRVLFPTVKYLRATESHRLRLTRVENWPLLALRLLACALLIFAISDPALVSRTASARAVILMIDSSLSMNTESSKEQALARARELILALSADDVAAVAQFDSSANLLCDFTSDRDSLEKGVASYSPNYSTTDFGRALAWANDLPTKNPCRKEIVLISDLQAANVFSSEPARLSNVDLKIVRIEGGPRINASHGAIAVRAAGDNLELESTALFDEGGRVTVTTASFKIARRDREVIAMASDSSATLSARMLEGGLIAGAVTANRPDELDADDSRFFVARLPGEKKSLLVASDQAIFIEKAIQASSRSETEAGGAEISGTIPESADALARYSVVISPVAALDKSRVAAAREYVRRGGSVILTAGVEADARYAAERFDEICSTDSRTSINEIAQADSLGLMPPASPAGNAPDAQAFAALRFRAAHSIQTSESETLLRYSDGRPAAARVRAGAGQVVMLGFGLSDKDSSLAHSAVFPTFVEWLISSVSANARVRQFTVGQAPTAALLRGLTRLTKLYSAGGPAREEVAPTESALARSGVYEAEYQSEKFIFALNPSPAESTLDRAADAELLKRVEIDNADVKAARSEKGIALWRVLAAGALVISLIELVYAGVRRDG